MAHALPNAYLGLKFSFGADDSTLKLEDGKEVGGLRARLLRRVVLTSHAMVIGLNLNELLVAMKVWKSFDKGKVGMEEATKAVVDEWKNDSACTTHHHDPEGEVHRCFNWLDATVGHHTDLLECELNPERFKELGKQVELIYGLHEDDEGEVKVSNENTMTDEDWKAMAKNETTQPGKLKYVRTLFLNILQEQYWNQIQSKMLVDEDIKTTISRVKKDP